MNSNTKAVICDEVFDENSVPSEQEVRDYAVKIGINPDTEKHLLNIALDGLMSPLPLDWKACFDERVNRIYYFNVKTNKTQWFHPLDEYFENLVKKKRLEESVSAGDDDSKTSIKEDLKSFEEAVTTSDMLPSNTFLDANKSKSSTTPLKSPSQTLKDLSPDGKRVLNPIGRPPLPPKRRPGSSSPSPKRGGLAGHSERSGLSLRLSPSSSSNRIDIDSIGVPVGLPSPELKSEKQLPSRTPAIKLTGGGSAFLKSKQKLSPSPSEETRKSFEIVREAESIDFPEDEDIVGFKDSDGKKLKHSLSLGESGFDVLTKSKKFGSLQESLLSLKNEMDLSNKSPSSSSPSALRGILREKPSPSAKLWDVDPLLLTSDEKEKLRLQEMREERKQNVRFADILHKPINIQFSKSDSEDDSKTNNSSDELDDMEQLFSDEDLRKDCRKSDSEYKGDLKAEFGEISIKQKSNKYMSESELFTKRKEPNKNILSRLTDLSTELSKKMDQTNENSGLLELENNNKEKIDEWLNHKPNTKNENDQNLQKFKKRVTDNAELALDSENNAVEKELRIINDLFTDTLDKNENLKISDSSVLPKKVTDIPDVLEKEFSKVSPRMSINVEKSKIDSVQDDDLDLSGKPSGFTKSKLMPEMDLQKMFQNVRDRIIGSAEFVEANANGVEPMQTSPLDGDEEVMNVDGQKASTDTGATHKTDESSERLEKHKARKLQGFQDHQKKLYEEKRAFLQQEFEENIYEIQKEFKRQESIEKQRIYMEVQQSVSCYQEQLEQEKNEREAQLRDQLEEFLKDLEAMLCKEKELKVKKIKEDHASFMTEQEKKTIEEKAQIEKESKIMLKTSSSQLEKIIADFKQKEENEISRLLEEKNKRLDEIRQKIENEQVEKEHKHKQELAIVEAEYERVLAAKREEIEKARSEHEVELAAVRSQQDEMISLLTEQHRQVLRQLQEQCHAEEESVRKKHLERMEILNAQLNRVLDKEDFTQMNREYEKVRCEKRLLEDKYKSLKEKYMRLKNEVRLSMERKRQAKLNRQLQQRDPTSTTEDTTDRSTDYGKPPINRRKPTTTVSSDEGAGDNGKGTPKTIKRRPKPPLLSVTSSATVESSSVTEPPAKPKNVLIPSPHQRREGVSSAEDNHTSVSEEIQLEYDGSGEKWTQSALTPLENLRKQLEKLDDLEEQFPNSVHTDTYLRYPFAGPAGGSCELDFYRHRLHLERESVRRAKQALSEQRLSIESRQVQLRHKQHTETLHQFHQEEKELTDMEVSLHRTRALLGEKIIRLRHLEQSIERATTFATHHPTDKSTTNTDSSGFSGSEIDLSNVGNQRVVGSHTENYWTENVLHSLENINSEIREIWAILGKQQGPGIGPPPIVNCENRAIGHGLDTYSLAPHRATDIADRTRRLKEWLIRTRDQQTHPVAPVVL